MAVGVPFSGDTELLDDTTPQLGGNLDTNNQDIIDATNGYVHVVGADGVALGPPLLVDADTVLIAQNSANIADDSAISIVSGSAGVSKLNFGTEILENIASIEYDAATGIASIKSPLTTYFNIDSIFGSLVFNEGGVDLDFRIEGIGRQNALFVQGSDGRVGISTGTLVSTSVITLAGNGYFRTTGSPATLTLDRTDGRIMALAGGTGSSAFRFDNAGSFAIQSQARADLEAQTGTSVTSILSLDGSAPANTLIADTSGNIILGASTTTHKLDVNGGMRLRPQASAPGTAEGGRLYYNSTTEHFIGYANGVDRLLNMMTPIPIRPQQLIADDTNGFGVTVRNQHVTAAFDDTTDEIGYYTGFLPNNYQSNGLTVDIVWVSETATSGNVVWAVAFERNADGGHDLDTDSWSVDQTATGAARTTSGQRRYTSIDFTSAQIDSLEGGEMFRMRVTRDANNASDTMSDDAQIVAIQIRGANE